MSNLFQGNYRYVMGAMLLAGLVGFGQTEALGQSRNPDDLRKYYVRSVKSADSAADFHQLMKDYEGGDPLKIGFAGAAQAIMAKHAWNPYNKVQYLKSGMEKINEAIALDSTDVELRFVRFSIEYSLPGFLGYNEHLKADRAVIQDYFLESRSRNKPRQVEQVILKFLIETGTCPPNVQKQLAEKLN